MNRTTKAYTLPDSHVAVLDDMAREMGMSPDKTLAAAIRLYQHVHIKSRDGFRMVFLDKNGMFVAEPVGGCMGDD